MNYGCVRTMPCSSSANLLSFLKWAPFRKSAPPLPPYAGGAVLALRAQRRIDGSKEFVLHSEGFPYVRTMPTLRAERRIVLT